MDCTLSRPVDIAEAKNSPPGKGASCLTYIASDGITYYVRAEFPRDTFPKPMGGIFVNKPLSSEGVYTYMIGANGDVYYAQAFNEYEIGSQHSSIAIHANLDKIRAAGELKRDAEGLKYNFMSGTYMADWQEGCNEASVGKILAEKLGEPVTFSAKAFKLPKTVTKEWLDYYVKQGVVFKLFTTVAACRASVASLNAMLAVQKRMASHPARDAIIAKAEAELAAANAGVVYTGGRRRKTRRHRVKRRRYTRHR